MQTTGRITLFDLTNPVEQHETSPFDVRIEAEFETHSLRININLIICLRHPQGAFSCQ